MKRLLLLLLFPTLVLAQPSGPITGPDSLQTVTELGNTTDQGIDLTSDSWLALDGVDFLKNPGTANICLGATTGDALTTGSGNVFIGDGAGDVVTEGLNNFLLGKDAGDTLTTGDSNVMIGDNVGGTTTTQDSNIYIGNNVAPSNEEERNVAIGANTMQAALTAKWNVAIGYNAASSITTSDLGTYIGFQAGDSFTTNDGTAIGASTLRLATKVGNTAIGANAGSNTTGQNGTFIGEDAGSFLTGNNNTIIGKDAGTGVNGVSTAAANVMIGQKSGEDMTTALRNVAVGDRVGESITSGSDNVLIGYFAGKSLTTHSDNVFIGQRAGETATVSGELHITNNNDSTPLIHGDFTNDEIEINGDFAVVGGHYEDEGTAPAVSACGTTPSIVATSTDNSGKVTIGSGGVTSCTVTFAATWNTAPSCIVTGNGATGVSYHATTSTTVLTITEPTDMSSDVVMYICIGNKA